MTALTNCSLSVVESSSLSPPEPGWLPLPLSAELPRGRHRPRPRPALLQLHGDREQRVHEVSPVPHQGGVQPQLRIRTIISILIWNTLPP